MSEVDLQVLSVRLGHVFRDSQLLETALTHRSVGHMNNERLEFLGDAIVNFLIAETLYQRFTRAKEGVLSRLRATLVRRETLAELANQLDIGPYLRLGVGELRSGGQNRQSILANTMEAVLGAIYLDAGMEVCRTLVLQWFSEHLAELSPHHSHKDPKTRLQEHLQSLHLPLPLYQVTRVEGDAHAQTFYVACVIESCDLTTEGVGQSRRKAEQEAAVRALDKLEHS